MSYWKLGGPLYYMTTPHGYGRDTTHTKFPSTIHVHETRSGWYSGYTDFGKLTRGAGMRLKHTIQALSEFQNISLQRCAEKRSSEHMVLCSYPLGKISENQLNSLFSKRKQQQTFVILEAYSTARCSELFCKFWLVLVSRRYVQHDH